MYSELAGLLPCPFCGEVPTLSKHFKYDMWQLIHRCVVVGPIIIEWTEYQDLIEKRWNTRAIAESGKE